MHGSLLLHARTDARTHTLAPLSLCTDSMKLTDMSKYPQLTLLTITTPSSVAVCSRTYLPARHQEERDLRFLDRSNREILPKRQRWFALPPGRRWEVVSAENRSATVTTAVSRSRPEGETHHPAQYLN